MSNLKFGLVGTGFMGKAHAIALSSVGTTFSDISAPILFSLADKDADRAAKLSKSWGFKQSSGDWRTLCADPEIDVIDICTPNHLHAEIALAAIAANKHVYCEKPLALSGAETAEIERAARSAGVRTSMGFNYMCNPLIGLARKLIQSGELGEILQFRGSYQEDYMASAEVPFSWRCLRTESGSGALADLGTHVINMAEYLLGPISGVFGNLACVHQHRPDPVSGAMREVENEDIAHLLLHFAIGCSGSMDISRVATGRKCGLGFEIYGTDGSIQFDQERMNELRHFTSTGAQVKNGFRTILSGPDLPDYAAFCPAPGHGLGINDLKVIELRNFISSIETGRPLFADFSNGHRVQLLVDAAEASHRLQQWIEVA